jgi:hypothetical protein
MVDELERKERRDRGLFETISQYLKRLRKTMMNICSDS